MPPGAASARAATAPAQPPRPATPRPATVRCGCPGLEATGDGFGFGRGLATGGVRHTRHGPTGRPINALPPRAGGGEDAEMHVLFLVRVVPAARDDPRGELGGDPAADTARPAARRGSRRRWATRPGCCCGRWPRSFGLSALVIASQIAYDVMRVVGAVGAGGHRGAVAVAGPGGAVPGAPRREAAEERAPVHGVAALVPAGPGHDPWPTRRRPCSRSRSCPSSCPPGAQRAAHADPARADLGHRGHPCGTWRSSGSSAGCRAGVRPPRRTAPHGADLRRGADRAGRAAGDGRPLTSRRTAAPPGARASGGPPPGTASARRSAARAGRRGGGGLPGGGLAGADGAHPGGRLPDSGA